MSNMLLIPSERAEQLAKMTDRELVLLLRGTGLLGSCESDELRKRGLFTGTALCSYSSQIVRDGRALSCCGKKWQGPVEIPPHQAPPAALHRSPDSHARLQVGGPTSDAEEMELIINAGRHSRYY